MKEAVETKPYTSSWHTTQTAITTLLCHSLLESNHGTTTQSWSRSVSLTSYCTIYAITSRVKVQVCDVIGHETPVNKVLPRPWSREFLDADVEAPLSMCYESSPEQESAELEHEQLRNEPRQSTIADQPLPPSRFAAPVTEEEIARAQSNLI